MGQPKGIRWRESREWEGIEWVAMPLPRRFVIGLCLDSRHGGYPRKKT